MLCFDSHLTEREEKARDIMVYLFNPVLKFLILLKNPEEFKRYEFNSCRQTAILGAGYLRKLLPDYEFRVYEGQFIEVINEIPVPYVHAYIVAVKHSENRHLIIDLSRTTKRLLFTEAYLNLYPDFDDYRNVVKVGQELVNLDAMLDTDNPEYLTGEKPRELLSMIDSLISQLQELPKQQQLAFCDMVYSNTTQLRR